jgi:hypothetical protein
MRPIRRSLHDARRAARRSLQVLSLAMVATFLLGCASQRAVADAPTAVPTDAAMFAAFVPAGHRAGVNAQGDFDGDGDLDALLVIEAEGEAAADAPRALLLLRRDSDRLTPVLESPRAVLCRRCGGMMGDPLRQLRIAPGELVLRFEGGSRELWSSEFRFVQAPDRTWRLDTVVAGGLDRADGAIAERRRDAQSFGEIPLQTFDPADFPADALP